MEAREDGSLHFFQKLHGFLSKHFKPPEKTKGELELNEQGLFVNVKQLFYSKEFINDTKEHQKKKKTGNFVHHPQNSNTIFCLQKISDSIRGSGEKDKLCYTSLTYQIQNGRKAGIMVTKFVLG